MKSGFNASTDIDAVIGPLMKLLSGHRRWVLLAAALTTVGAAFIDRASGPELSLAALYLGPVAVIAWFLGRNAGRGWALLVSVASLLAEITATGATVDPQILAWNTVAVLMLSLIVVEVLTRLRHSLDMERDLARTDALTGVANTRHFKELATIELERSRRYGRTFTLASLDLDNFKNVNDTMGHAAGDRLIHDVGQAVRRRLRRVDIVARIGGDEFVVLLPETNEAAATVALSHVREALETLTDGYGPAVKASIGAVTFVSPPSSVEEMLQLADVAMYQAKNAGGDRVESLTISRTPNLDAV
ncbi:MAG TPA: GGDEF domain-containing protein [Coriobacteriia bacterium]